MELDRIYQHLRDLRSDLSDRRIRLVAIAKLQPATDPLSCTFTALCARSEGCIICQKVLDDFRAAGFRIADVGVFSPVEMQHIGRREAATPPPTV